MDECVENVWRSNKSWWMWSDETLFFFRIFHSTQFFSLTSQKTQKNRISNHTLSQRSDIDYDPINFGNVSAITDFRLWFYKNFLLKFLNFLKKISNCWFPLVKNPIDVKFFITLVNARFFRLHLSKLDVLLLGWDFLGLIIY